MLRIIISLLFLQSAFIFAQDFPGGYNPDSDKESKAPSTFYAGFTLKGANLIEDWGVELGGRFGGFINKYVSIGAGFYYLFTQTIHYKSYDSPVEPHLRLVYFGPEAELHLPIHEYISVSAILGTYLGQVNEGTRSDVDISHDLVGDWIYSLDPGICIYTQIMDNISVGLSYQYRSSFGVDFKTLTNDDLSGNIISLSIIIK
jgi:opacity protein-like surface antigen